MAETAVSDGDEPQKPTNRLLPDLSNLQEFYRACYPEFTNGRMRDVDSAIWPLEGFYHPVQPRPTTVGERKLWKQRVKASIVRREEILKNIPAMLKERARVKVYDYIFGWILEDPERGHSRLGAYSNDRREDVTLFL